MAQQQNEHRGESPLRMPRPEQVLLSVLMALLLAWLFGQSIGGAASFHMAFWTMLGAFLVSDAGVSVKRYGIICLPIMWAAGASLYLLVALVADPGFVPG